MDKYEAIARKYCELSGIDPEKLSLGPCPDNKPGCLVAHYERQWEKCARIERERENEQRLWQAAREAVSGT